MTRIGDWDPNPASDGVTGYNLFLDGAKVGTVLPAVTQFTFTVYAYQVA